MEPIILIMAGGTMLLLAVGATTVLGWANRAFHVEVDPRIDRVLAALPGANCGGCGYVGCGPYAEAVVERGEAVDKCPVGGASVAEAVAEVMGIEVAQSWPKRPAVHCRARTEQRLGRHPYTGEATCAAANFVAGVQGCTYGCLGFGDCVRSCAFDAIHIVDGVAVVDYEACTGCGACARVCPRNIISMVPFKRSRMLVVACSNLDMGKDVKNVCATGCIGCKACGRRSPIFSFAGEGDLPRIDYEAYEEADADGVRTAIEKCPMEGLVFVGKPTSRDVAAAGDEEVPDVVMADFKTTADDAEWRG